MSCSFLYLAVIPSTFSPINSSPFLLTSSIKKFHKKTYYLFSNTFNSLPQHLHLAKESIQLPENQNMATIQKMARKSKCCPKIKILPENQKMSKSGKPHSQSSSCSPPLWQGQVSELKEIF